MSKLRSFYCKVIPIKLVRHCLQWNLFHNLKTVSRQTCDLLRVVRHQTHFANPQVHQNLRSDAVFPQIRRESETLVCFNRIPSLPCPASCRREFCSAAPCRVPPAACRAARLAPPFQSSPLPTATARRNRNEENRTRRRLNTVECTRTNTGSPSKSRLSQGDVCLFVIRTLVGIQFEFAVIGRKFCLSHPSDKRFGLPAIRDEVGNRDDL